MSRNFTNSEGGDSDLLRTIDRLKRLRRFLRDSLRLLNTIIFDLEGKDASKMNESLEDKLIYYIHESGLVSEKNELVTEEDILEVLAKEMGMELVDLDKVEVTPELLAMIPASVARQYRCFPVIIKEDALHVAIDDPLNIQLQDDLARLLKKKLVFLIASENQMDRFIKRYYTDTKTD